MSAFLCSPEHLNALVNYAQAHARGGCHMEMLKPPAVLPRGATPADADCTIEVLLRENLASLRARYGEKASHIDDWISEPVEYRFNFEPLSVRKPIDIIKLCHCYSYQACEHEGWETSDAKRWIDTLERHAIGHLPGYDAAPWGL